MIVACLDRRHGLSLVQFGHGHAALAHTQHVHHTDIWVRTDSSLFVFHHFVGMRLWGEIGRAVFVPLLSFAASPGVNGSFPLGSVYINGRRLGR